MIRTTTLATLIGFMLSAFLAVGTSLAQCTHYTVQPGDGLYRIALQHNLTLAQLLAANPGLSVRSILHPGDCLNLPGQTQSVIAAPAGAGQPSQASIPWHTLTYGKPDTYDNVTFAGVTFAVDRLNYPEDYILTNEQFTWDHNVYHDPDPTVFLIAHTGMAGQYLYQLAVGDIIRLQTHTGIISRYRVTGNAIVINAYSPDLFDDPGQMLLRTCWPIYSDGSSGKDLDVYAELIP